LLYGEITALCNKEGYCWAGNSYFANLYGTSERNVRRWIENLKSCKYIEVTYHDKGRSIRLAELSRTKMSAPPDKNVRPPGQKCPKNTTTNITLNKSFSKEKDNKLSNESYVPISEIRKWKNSLEILKKLKGFRMPNLETLYEEGSVKWTKTGVSILSSLNELEKGEFQRGTSNKTDLILKPMVVADIEKMIEKQVDKFLLALDEKYWPKNKKALKSVTGKNFLKTYSNFSWLLWIMNTDVKPIREALEDQKMEKEEKIDADLIWDYSRLLYDSDNPLSEKEVIKAIRSVFNRVEGIVNSEDFHRMENSGEFFDKEEVARQYLRFLDSWESVGIGNVYSDKTWKLFDNFVWKNYGVDLSMKREEALRQIQDSKDTETLERKKEIDRKKWKSGEANIKKYIYDDSIRYTQFVGGKDIKSKAIILWDSIKESWIKKYGNVEWIEENIDGVVDSGGIIKDSKGIRSLLQFVKAG
jgi:hypothetical protein